jgi:hypothetical protein
MMQSAQSMVDNALAAVNAEPMEPATVRLLDLLFGANVQDGKALITSTVSVPTTAPLLITSYRSF